MRPSNLLAAARKLFAACLGFLLAALTAHAQQITGTPGSPAATTTIDGRYLPAPPQKFEGEIDLNAAQSKGDPDPGVRSHRQ